MLPHKGSVQERLGRFVAEANWESLPAHVQEMARVRTLDILACSLPAYQSEIGATIVASAAGHELRQGSDAALWLTGCYGSAAESAFSNSVLAHALLQDDVGIGGHPGANVVPSAFAVADAVGATGREFLTAVAIGYEVQVRMGAGGLHDSAGDRGLRGTTTTGTFGAAAAASSAFGLDTAKSTSALAFAASLCVPGIEQPLLVGSDERSLQMAANTASGVRCAELARAGFHGAESALGGSSGFFVVYGRASGDVEEVAEGIGEEWISPTLRLKPYPTAGWNTGPIYSALQIVARDRVAWSDIEDIHVMHTWWHRNTAYIYPGPFETTEQALISCQFAIAVCFLYGRFDWEAIQRGLQDPRVDELARLIRVDGVATWGFTDGAVTVTTRVGERFSADAFEIEHSIILPTWDEALRKYSSQTASIPLERANRVAELVGDLENAADVRALGDELVAGNHATP